MFRILPSLAAVAVQLFASAAPLGAARGVAQDGDKGDQSALLRENERIRLDAARKQREAGLSREDLAQALRLDQPPEACVAYDPAGAACLLTVAGFNRGLEGRDFAAEAVPEPQPGGPEDGPEGSTRPEPPVLTDVYAIRSGLLRDLLNDRYLAAGPLPAGVRDSLDALADSLRRDDLKAFRANLGDSALRALYRKHHAELFKGKEEKTFRVLASSDSAFLDFLGRRGPDSLWAAVPAAELPAKARAASGKPVPSRFPFGFLLVRPGTTRNMPDTPFEAAVPALIALAISPSSAEGEAAREAEVAAWYASHREDFAVPDTVKLRLWLVPDRRPGRLSSRIMEQRLREDTSRVRPLEADARDLPPAVAEAVARLGSLEPGDLLGPIPSSFGTWHMRVAEVRRGRGFQTLAEARPRVRKALYGDYGEGGGSPVAAALEGGRSKAEEARKERVSAWLRSRSGESGRGAGASAWERDRDRWISRDLVLRFVDAGSEAAP